MIEKIKKKGRERHLRHTRLQTSSQRRQPGEKVKYKELSSSLQAISATRMSTDMSPVSYLLFNIFLSKVKNRKPSGPDKIFNEHIKASAEILNLLNTCLQTGNIPTKWKTSTIQVLYKGKGDPQTPQDCDKGNHTKDHRA